jgi:hypothetical protein
MGVSPDFSGKSDGAKGDADVSDGEFEFCLPLLAPAHVHRLNQTTPSRSTRIISHLFVDALYPVGTRIYFIPLPSDNFPYYFYVLILLALPVFRTPAPQPRRSAASREQGRSGRLRFDSSRFFQGARATPTPILTSQLFPSESLCRPQGPAQPSQNTRYDSLAARILGLVRLPSPFSLLPTHCAHLPHTLKLNSTASLPTSPFPRCHTPPYPHLPTIHTSPPPIEPAKPAHPLPTRRIPPFLHLTLPRPLLQRLHPSPSVVDSERKERKTHVRIGTGRWFSADSTVREEPSVTNRDACSHAPKSGDH